MDSTMLLAGIVGIVAWTIIIFLFGKWQDVAWKIKQMRNLTKKDWMLIIVRSRDSKTLMMKSVLPENGVVRFKGTGDMWLAKKDRVYRFEKEEQGFKIGKDELKYIEGVPCLIIDYDNVKPSHFADEIDEREKTGVAPGELGVWTDSYIDNEVAKDRETAKKLAMMITVALVLSLIAVAIGGFTLMKVMDMDTTLQKYMNTTATPQAIGQLIPAKPVTGAIPP